MLNNIVFMSNTDRRKECMSKSNGRNQRSSKRNYRIYPQSIGVLKATVSNIIVFVIDHWQCFVL